MFFVSREGEYITVECGSCFNKMCILKENFRSIAKESCVLAADLKCPACGKITSEGTKIGIDPKQQQEQYMTRVKQAEKLLSTTRQQYTYTTDVIVGLEDGMPNDLAIRTSLANHARQGWRLHTALADEIGKRSESGIFQEKNAIISAVLLIYERPVELEDMISMTD